MHTLNSLVIASGKFIGSQNILRIVIPNFQQSFIFTLFCFFGFNLLCDLYIQPVILLLRHKIYFTILGFFFGVLNVGGVTDLNRFENSVDSLITSMKESPKAAGVGEIFVAGEIENRKQKISQAEGVNISDAVIRELREVSEMSGIPFECEF